MRSMRRLITLCEAPKPKPMTNAERIAQENARVAQELIKTKATAQQVKTKAMEVSKQAQRELLFRSWDKSWIEQVRARITQLYRQRLQAAKADFELDREVDPNAILNKPSFYDCMTEALQVWWENEADLEWGDAAYQYEEYQDAHPKTEASDDMSRLQAGVDLLTQIRFRGGLGSLESMAQSLDAIDTYLDILARHMDGGWSSSTFSSAINDICVKGLPLIMFFCNSLIALP